MVCIVEKSDMTRDIQLRAVFICMAVVYIRLPHRTSGVTSRIGSMVVLLVENAIPACHFTLTNCVRTCNNMRWLSLYPFYQVSPQHIYLPYTYKCNVLHRKSAN
jgi:hypothetical protein